MRKLLPAVLMCLVGCGVNPGKNPDPVEITGKVALSGKPVADATLNFQPTGTGTQATMKVKGGEFRGSITPGKYTYYLTEGAYPAAIQSVPAKFRSGAMDRQIEVTSAAPLTLNLE